MNAADFVYGFFKKNDVDSAWKGGYRFPDLIVALEEIDKTIQQLKLSGTDTEGFEDCLPRWRESVTNAFKDSRSPTWDPINGPVDVDTALNPGDAACLKWMSEKMSDCSLTFTQTQREKINELISDSIEVIKSMNGLPDGLTKYLFRLISETRTALNEYEVTGDFKLEDAFSRLREALDIAIVKTESEHPGKWDPIRRKLSEIATGFIIAAPSIAIDAANLFAQLQIGS